MEHTTFAKKTVVLAALGALSLMAATVRAADETEIKPTPISENITVTIGGDKKQDVSEIKGEDAKVNWNQEWFDTYHEDGTTFGGVTVVKGENGSDTITVAKEGSFTINLPTSEAYGKVVTFQGTGLKVENGGVFSNSSYLKFTDGGSLTVAGAEFNNGKDGVIAFEGKTFSIDAGFSLDAEDKDTLGNFENAGLIIVDSTATMNIGSEDSAIREVGSDDKFSLNVGNVEIKSGTLTNYDKGYQVEKGTGDKAKGDAEGEDAAPVQTLVKFGTVTVAKNGKFVNAAGALSEGSALVLEAENTVVIDGTSVWNTLNLSNVGAGKTVNNYVKIAEKQEGKNGGDFRVTGALVIDQFGADQDGKAGAFTIDGATNDSKVFADGVDISAGSHIATTALEQKNAGEGLTWKTDGKPTVGTLKLTGFAATFEEAVETPEEGAKAEEGEDEATTNGSWTYKKLGDVTAVNTNLKISGSKSSSEGSDPYDGHGYTPSLEMSSLNLVGTSMKIAYDVDVERIKDAITDNWKGDPIDMDGWTKDNILEELEALLEEDKYADLKTALEGHRDTFETGLADVLTKKELSVESEISGSDLSIGTLTIARNTKYENTTVKVEKPFQSETNEGESGDGTATTADDSSEDGTTSKPETVTITGNDVYDLGDLTLTVTESNLDVGTLDLQTGAITLKDSKMMVDNVKTLNGSLTLESGYLGLNVTKNIADLVDKKDEAETKADPDTAPAGATLELGSPVTIGESGKLTIGGADTTSDGTKVDYAISIAGTTDIVFDGRNFSSEALFSQDRTDGNKGKVTVGEGGSINVKATNLSWGVYKLFDEETLDTTGLTGGEEGNIKVEVSDETVNGLWKDAVGDKISAAGNEIVVGGKTIEGSGLDIGAVNLANSVVGGDRGSALDKVLFNHILSNGKSLDEISNTINSITAMGAVAGLTAMTVDFGAYVTDQVEHHASTIPHQQEGWWVQPIAGKLKSDDLAVGGMKGGYSIDTVGIMGGFDKKLRNGDTIGVAASYQSGDADSEGEGLPVTTDVTNYGLHLWHARQFDAYRLMGLFSYSKTSGDAKMNYAGNELTSDLGATEISIGARADKEFKWNTVRMIPHVGVRASMIDVDDYTIEMGSEELFKVSEDKLWIFEVPVGVTFASSFEYARWNVQPYVDLTVRGRFGDTDSTFTLEGSNTSDSMKYDVTGDVIGDLRIGYMSTFQDLNLGMSYGLSAGDGGRQNHQIEATLRLDF